MKKKVIIVAIVVILLILLFPIRNVLKDGGSVEYKAILYNITKIHRINLQSSTGYEDGWKIKILGITIYNRYTYDKTEKNITLEDVNDKIINYFSNKQNDTSNLAYNYIDSEKQVIVVGLVDNSKNNQEEFMSSVFSDSKYIKYIKDNAIIEFKESKDIFEAKIIVSEEDYITVEVLKDSNQFKKGDKVTMKITRPTDGTNDFYVVGNNVKITFNGNVEESDPAQIGATKIELKSSANFELIFNKEPGNVKSQIIDKNTSEKYDYNVYVYNGIAEIVIDDKTYTLEEALKDNKITMDEIIAKAKQDIPDAIQYLDGGSIEYHYADYTIIKLHTLDGNRDVYIGEKNLTLNDIE